MVNFNEKKKLLCLVIAIDIDPNKIKLARHNAKIYGVEDKIEFIVGDFFNLAPFLKADVVFMSPPWGGPGYWINEVYSIEVMCEKHYGGGFGIFHEVKSIAPSIAFHLPKTTNIYEVGQQFTKIKIILSLLVTNYNFSVFMDGRRLRKSGSATEYRQRKA